MLCALLKKQQQAYQFQFNSRIKIAKYIQKSFYKKSIWLIPIVLKVAQPIGLYLLCPREPMYKKYILKNMHAMCSIQKAKV